MKKIIISVLLIGFIGFFSLQQANAGRGKNMNTGPGCPAWNSGYGQFQNDASQKDIDAFLQATIDSRKDFAMKQAEYQAAMNSANPDPARAAAITGEIFQLRDRIQIKAKESGLRTGNCGAGYGCGGRGGNNYGPGGGRGYCRGYMN